MQIVTMDKWVHANAMADCDLDLIELTKEEIRRKIGIGPWVFHFEEIQEPQWHSIRVRGWIEVEE